MRVARAHAHARRAAECCQGFARSTPTRLLDANPPPHLRQFRSDGIRDGCIGSPGPSTCDHGRMNEPLDFSTLPLSPALLQGVDALGYAAMTPIQAQALPAILEGRDLIAQAPTGSGKTAAFGLGLLHRLDPARSG